MQPSSRNLTAPGTDRVLVQGQGSGNTYLFDPDRQEVKYKVVDSIPILMPTVLPESSGRVSGRVRIEADVEAYSLRSDSSLMSATLELDVRRLRRLQAFVSRTAYEFGDPLPPMLWDKPFDGSALLDVYTFLFSRPSTGLPTAQLGGRGLHALQSIVLGVDSAVLISPVWEECRHAIAVAERLNLDERLTVAVGIAESLPLPRESLGAVIVAGSMHHFDVSESVDEVARVLHPDGRFGAAEPWRAPGYSLGIAVFGKREEDVDCVPLDPTRMDEFHDRMPASLVIHHGALTRYLLLALAHLGLTLPHLISRWLVAADDQVASRLRIRSFGSSVACLGAMAPVESDGWPH